MINGLKKKKLNLKTKIKYNMVFKADKTVKPVCGLKRKLNGRCVPVQQGGGTSACRPALSAVQHAD